MKMPAVLLPLLLQTLMCQAEVLSEENRNFINTLLSVQTCARKFQCTPYRRCHQLDILSDARPGVLKPRIGLEQFNREREHLSHSECTRANEVCCRSPQPESAEPKSAEPELTEPKVAEYVPRCGRRNQHGLGMRIIDVTDSRAQFGEFPWVAQVIQNLTIGDVFTDVVRSVGSLVHPQLVLTSAHNVTSLPVHDLKVRLGEWDVNSESEARQYEDHAVLEVKVHPDFNPINYRDDVALLVLERPVQPKPHIDTLCLPSAGVNYDGAACVTTGWGKDANDGKFQNKLKQVELPHVPRDACEAALRTTSDLGPYFSLDQSFTCAGGEAGRDACEGDGGAPLACRDPQQPDRYVQLGVVSWGLDCGLPDVPGVYADVLYQLTWINQVIEQLERSQKVDISNFGRNG